MPVEFAATAAMTGAEYLESLDDGRVVYIYGERVAKVTEHPAFRDTARMIARLYDAMHDPERRPGFCLGSSCMDAPGWR